MRSFTPFLDADIFDGQVVIASDFMARGSLSDWLKRHGGQTPTVKSAIKMIQGIFAGLGHLHTDGIIHRDLKPENVLLQTGSPRFKDFLVSLEAKSREESETGYCACLGDVIVPFDITYE